MSTHDLPRGTSVIRSGAKVRLAGPGDAEAISRVYDVAFATTARQDGSVVAAWLARHGVDYWLSRLRREAGRIVVSYDTSVSGFAAWVPTTIAGEPAAELDRLFVLPEAQGGGHGTALHDRVIRDARTSQAVLWVLAGNESAKCFYRRHGWADAGVRRSRRVGGGELAWEMWHLRTGAPDGSDVPT